MMWHPNINFGVFLCVDVDLHDMMSAHGRVLDEKNRTNLQILYSLRQGKENESTNPVQFPKQEDLNTFTLMAQDPDSNFEVVPGYYSFSWNWRDSLYCLPLCF